MGGIVKTPPQPINPSPSHPQEPRVRIEGRRKLREKKITNKSQAMKRKNRKKNTKKKKNKLKNPNKLHLKNKQQKTVVKCQKSRKLSPNETEYWLLSENPPTSKTSSDLRGSIGRELKATPRPGRQDVTPASTGSL